MLLALYSIKVMMGEIMRTTQLAHILLVGVEVLEVQGKTHNQTTLLVLVGLDINIHGPLQ
tara:strand:- start:386 stop:565 length:180 start_codon:yes stop_codon:yes gene_type:complete